MSYRKILPLLMTKCVVSLWCCDGLIPAVLSANKGLEERAKLSCAGSIAGVSCSLALVRGEAS